MPAAPPDENLSKFGVAIKQIYKFPNIPNPPIDGCWVGVPLDEQKRFFKRIKDKYETRKQAKTPSRRGTGLSIRDFIELCDELLRVSAATPANLITKDKLVRLMNKGTERVARTRQINPDVLKQIALFSKKHTFEDLLVLANQPDSVNLANTPIKTKPRVQPPITTATNNGIKNAICSTPSNRVVATLPKVPQQNTILPKYEVGRMNRLTIEIHKIFSTQGYPPFEREGIPLDAVYDIMHGVRPGDFFCYLGGLQNILGLSSQELYALLVEEGWVPENGDNHPNHTA